MKAQGTWTQDVVKHPPSLQNGYQHMAVVTKLKMFITCRPVSLFGCLSVSVITCECFQLSSSNISRGQKWGSQCFLTISVKVQVDSDVICMIFLIPVRLHLTPCWIVRALSFILNMQQGSSVDHVEVFGAIRPGCELHRPSILDLDVNSTDPRLLILGLDVTLTRHLSKEGKPHRGMGDVIICVNNVF